MQEMSIDAVRTAAESVIENLPPYWKEFRTKQLSRVSEEISWIYSPQGTVVDLGGSNGFHASVCSKLGMQSFCVDNFKVRLKGSKWDYFYEQDLEAETVATSLGVQFIHTDLLTWDPPFAKNSIDSVMSFDNIEHLHHSPRSLYQKMSTCLKQDGLLLIGGPNASNILKRFRVLFGNNIFSPFDEWYMHEQFIGHVREPIVADYLKIAEDLNLHVESIIGRNWLGLSGGRYNSKNIQLVAQSTDLILRNFPTLCSDIYLLASKS
jgi:SAM-dependent methyltransferase